jgi:hypothetical protein
VSLFEAIFVVAPSVDGIEVRAPPVETTEVAVPSVETTDGDKDDDNYSLETGQVDRANYYK